MQSTSSNLFKVQATENPSISLSSSDHLHTNAQRTPSRSSSPMGTQLIPSGENRRCRRSFVEDDDEEVVIPITAVRKQLDHSQPRVSSIRRHSTSLPNTLSKAKSMDVVRQQDHYVIQDHYYIQSFGQQHSTSSSPTPRKRRVSQESSKSIQSNYSTTSVFGPGGSINRFPQMMKSSLGSMKQFVSRSASISTSSRSRFSLRPGDKSNARGVVSNSNGPSLESVQESSYSPQPSINSISTPTQKGSKISRFRNRTSSIIDLSTIFTKPTPKTPSSVNDESSYRQSNISAPANGDRHERPLPKIMITNQQQNDTQKAQDPRHVHGTDHTLQSTHQNGNCSKRIDEYLTFTDKPGGVGTILFGKEIADINIEDISSDVDPVNNKNKTFDENINDTNQQFEKLALASTAPSENDSKGLSPVTGISANKRPDRRSRGSYSGLGSILITATLTTLHSKVSSECDQLLTSIVMQQGYSHETPFPMDNFQCILDDLKKMANMIEGSLYKEYLNQRFESLVQKLDTLKSKNVGCKPTAKGQEDVCQSTLLDTKSFIFDIKHFSNECLSQHYQFNENAMVIPAKGYWIEGNNKYNHSIARVDSTASQPDYTNWEMEHYDHMAKWFRTYFVGQDYLTVCGKCNEQNVLITIMEEKNIAPESQEEHSDSDEPAVHTSDIQYRVILRRTTLPDIRCLLSSGDLKAESSAASDSSGSGTSNDLNTVWPSIVTTMDTSLDPSELHVIDADTMSSFGIDQNIIRLDEIGVHNRYKFGVLSVRDGQTKEEEWFANSETPESLDRFLNIVGNRVELQGYEGWSAGLDTRSGDSGTYTYISTWKDSVLAFHVSTLIPSRPVDKQHIQRKRHIGNDIVCIIFVDGRQPFNPAAIKSQFLHVFIVVHEERVGDQFLWRVEVVANEHVNKFGPPLPPDGVFHDRDQLCSYMHAKLLNAENAALKSPKFALPSARAREGILLNHIQRATSLIEKPIGSSRHAKSPSTLSDPSGSPKGDESTLEFNLPDKSALGRGRPNMLPGLSRRRSTHEAGGNRAKPWISRNKKGKGYSRDQAHRRSRSELDLPVSVENSGHDNDGPLLDDQVSGPLDREGIRGRAQYLFASLQQWGGRWNPSPYRSNVETQHTDDGRTPSENA